MSRFVILFAVLIAVLATACSTESSRPGRAEVYERIDSMTSCVELQEEFNTAMNNVEARSPGAPLRDISLSYANAADDRMREIGCYN